LLSSCGARGGELASWDRLSAVERRQKYDFEELGWSVLTRRGIVKVRSTSKRAMVFGIGRSANGV
jgi:hypothetical protein